MIIRSSTFFGLTLALLGALALPAITAHAAVSTDSLVGYPTSLLRELRGVTAWLIPKAEAAASTDSLVGYWKFDEGTGTLAADSSGHGNNGTLTNGPTWSASPTNNISFTNPYALSFDGSNDYVALPPIQSIMGVADYSLSAWTRLTGNSIYTIFTQSVDGNHEIVLQIGRTTAGMPEYFSYEGGYYKAVGTIAVNDGAWHHVAVSRVGSVSKLYIDGALNVTGQAISVLGTAAFNSIGVERYGVSDFYGNHNGTIDDVRIYSRALSAAEISVLAAGNHTTAVWDGSSSTDWETSANWDINAVPDPFTNIIIRTGPTNRPLMTLAESGASLTIEGTGSLTLAGNNFELNDGGALKGGGTLKLRGNEVLSNLGNLATTSTGTVLYYGTGSFTGLAAGDSYNNLTINDGLVGYWKFDEGTGTLAADSSGHGNNGTLTNGPTWSSDPTNSITFTNPYALSFDGTDDYVDANSHLLSNLTAVTVCFWAKPTATNKRMEVSEGTNSTTRAGYGLAEDGNVYILPASTSAYGYANWSSLGVSSYIYYCGVFDGSQADNASRAKIYLNGVQQSLLFIGTIPSSVGAFTGNTQFGVRPDGVDYSTGLLDDVRIYSRALSPAEVAALAAGNQPSLKLGTFTLDAALDVNGDLVLNGGTLDTSSSNYGVTVGGSWENNGGVFTARKGTVTLDGTTSGLKLLSGGQRFDKLTLNGAGSTYTLADHLTTSGALALTNGTLDASSTGNFTVRAGTINQTSGIFTPRSGTVILTSSADATATITSTLNTLRIEDSSESGLVAYWKFDEGTNSGMILDSSGYGNTGVRRGGAGKIWSGSSLPSLQFENRYAMQFDGTDDYVTAADSSSLDVTSGITLSAWIKPDSFPAYAAVAGKFSPGLTGYTLDVDDGGGNARFWVNAGGDKIAQFPNSQISTSSWSLLTGTYDGSNVKIYLNGVEKASTLASGAISTNSDPFIIGKLYNAYADFLFDGLLDDVRIYNRALSANEIANLARGRYASGNSSTSTFTLGANLSTATLALDSGNISTSNRTLTVTNALTMLRGGGNLTLGSATTTLNGGLTLSGSTLTGGAGTLDVNGAVQILTGSLIAPSGSLTVSGNWNKTGGTFTHNAGTVEFDGTSQTLSGSLIFYNLTNLVPGGSFFLAWNGHTSVSGALVLRGTLGNVLNIRSTRSGSAATLILDTDGTQTMDYLDVKDSDASGGTALYCLTGCLNSGNTTNWQLANPSVSFASGSLTISETSGTATLTINLSGSTLRTVTIPFTITGTATGTGSDFTVLTPSPLRIEAGETSTGILIRFINDAAVESSETMILTLGTPTNATLGATGALTVTLTSDDSTATGDGGPSTWLLNLRRENNLTGGGQPTGGAGGGGTPSNTGITSFVPDYEPLAQAMRDSQERARETIDTTILDPRRIPAIREALIARFQLLKAEERQIIAEDDLRTAEQERLADRHRQQQLRERQELALEQAAENREQRIAERIAAHETTIARLAIEQETLQKQYAERREERLQIALQRQEEALKREQLALQREQDALRAEQEQNAQEREERIAERKELEESSPIPSPSLTPTPLPSTDPKVIAARRGRLFAIVDDQPVMFNDVSTSEWYAPFVSYVIGEKIAQGYKDAAGKLTGEFGVSKPVTYAEILKMAMEAAEQSPGPMGPPRNRTAQGHWSAAYVALAEALDLSVFRPSLDVQTPATRGEVIQTILEVMGFPIAKQPASYSDVPDTHPFTHAIATATFHGLVQGDTSLDGSSLGTFRPDEPINRAEVSKIIALLKEALRQ